MFKHFLGFHCREKRSWYPVIISVKINFFCLTEVLNRVVARGRQKSVPAERGVRALLYQQTRGQDRDCNFAWNCFPLFDPLLFLQTAARIFFLGCYLSRALLL